MVLSGSWFFTQSTQQKVPLTTSLADAVVDVGSDGVGGSHVQLALTSQSGHGLGGDSVVSGIGLRGQVPCL